MNLSSVTPFVIVTLVAASALAQSPARSILNAGILNGRAVTMPKPEYPEIARQACIGGIVAVNVVVDESGLVIEASADPLDQHTSKKPDGTEAERRKLDPALIQAAESAARQATFKPFQIRGVPVKFAGRLMYDFVADKSDLPPRIGDIYGPLINARAVKFPQPEWPLEARAAVTASQTVSVYVTVDESGRVISAEAVSGLPLFHAAAEAAALKAEFKPWMVMGTPVQARGVLTYIYKPKP
jgi:outer membrane biosynthesis protein TonB